MNLIRAQLKTKRQRVAAIGLGAGCFFAVLLWSGVEAFQRHTEPVPLAATERPSNLPSLGDRPAPKIELTIETPTYEVVDAADPPGADQPAVASEPRPVAVTDRRIKLDRLGKPIIVNGKPWTGEVFDHKPIRPLYTRTMKTTAYSPDERSCGKWADGITASGKSVWMNGGRLAAADRKIPYGTILTVPGYNNGQPVQVWDRGGKIKGNRLDLLYPTHEIALRWGVQDLPVVFWEFVETD
ncbi:MAG: 3D domain-containing protein [Planctomycetota bacterium]